MATIHVCDNCGDEFVDKDEVTVVGVKKGEKFNMQKTIASLEFCEACGPDELADFLVDKLKTWPGGESDV